MEYDFTYDQKGQPQAEFSMDHELMGQWFTDELGQNIQQSQTLIDAIEELEFTNFGEKIIQGKNLTLTLTPHEVVIAGEEFDDHQDQQLADHGLDGMEDKAECGLQDFKSALLDWKDFITK